MSAPGRPPLLSVADALAAVLSGVRPLGVETVALDLAHDRVLARDIRAGRDQPPFDASAMDGYAVRSQDTAVAMARLKLIGTSKAGEGYPRTVRRGETVRIFTGAPMPRGTDAVLIQENAQPGAASEIVASESVRGGLHVRRRGLDYAKGEIVLSAGRRLNARDLGMAASLNHPALPVRLRPAVAIAATGDELVRPGMRPGIHQIVSSNTFALAAAVSRFGGSPTDVGVVPDKLSAIKAAIRRNARADILVFTGGASVGEHDLVRQALAESGIRLDFWKIAMRPGKPLIFARHGRQRILGLPGNPVSALVCARIFLKPLIAALLGMRSEDDRVTARLGAAMKANDLREEYARGTLARAGDGTLVAMPFDTQDSSMLKVFQRAQCLIIRPPFAAAATEGTVVEVLPLDF